MLGQIRNFSSGIARNLVSLDSQPIGKAALTVVLFLDLFILISIFDGLARHTSQLTQPLEYIPSHCREIVIKGDWNSINQLVRISQIVSDYRESYAPRKVPTEDRHPTCNAITALIDSLKKEQRVAANLMEFLQLRVQLDQTRSELNRIKGTYDTSLLETMARDEAGATSAAAISKQVTAATENIEALVVAEESLRASLVQDERLIDLFAIIEAVSEEERDRLADEVRSLNFWYPAKRLGMEFIFLVPLVAVFYFWNSRSVAGARPFQVLLSSHLMIIVFIPVVFKIMELVYDIIPKRLLKELIELLESLRLVALWHYLLMALAILAALMLVYLFQKKLFSHEKLLAKRISNGLCQNCGVHLPPDNSACPLCGFEQFRQCEHCGHATYVFGTYCRECGRSQ
jgi:hypothetical protein|tara:strand:- start:5089 stop:6291 length:1203 start_codon:yes stop_codon:yes gene_type:complete